MTNNRSRALMSQLPARTTTGPYDILLCVPDLRGRERDYLDQCIRDNWISSAGPFVDVFEERIAKLHDQRFAIATSSGTAALDIALKSLDLRAGDRVLMPGWTFSATANAAIHAGAEPYFVDISPKNLGMDADDLDAAMAANRANGKRVAAVVVVHAFGRPAEMERLVEVCRKHDVALIEDAAGAIGSRYKGRPVGTFGRSSILSFNGNKLVCAGGGGMALTDDADLAEQMRLRSANSHGPNYHYKVIGYNHRMTNLSAAIGLAQIERLDEMLALKKALSKRYDDALARSNKFAIIDEDTENQQNHWIYCILINTTELAVDLYHFMEARRIQVRIFWRLLSSEPAFAKFPGSKLEVCRTISGRVVALPCSSSLSIDDQQRVIDAVREWDTPGSAA
jgi:perosamine synthetase